MSEQFLNRPQIDISRQQMARKAVPESMRRDALA
jgi:hypothetical protein